jgi:hypothetical protein
LDYLLSTIASIDNPALEAVGATARVLVGVFDFTTFEQTTLFEQSFELLGPGDLFSSTAGVPIAGEIVVPGSGSVGFNVDVYADGVAISTVPVPAALVLFCSGFAGLLGMGLRRRTAGRLDA